MFCVEILEQLMTAVPRMRGDEPYHVDCTCHYDSLTVPRMRGDEPPNGSPLLAIIGKRIFLDFRRDEPATSVIGLSPTGHLTPTSSLAWDRRKWIGPAAEPTADRASAEGR